MSKGEEREDDFFVPDEDYKSYYFVIQQAFEETDNFDVIGTVSQIEHCLKLVDNKEGNKKLTEDHATYLIHEAIPNIVRALLQRRYSEIHTGEVGVLWKVNQFLQSVLAAAIPLISSDASFNVLETLRRVFDENRFFYMQTSNWEDNDEGNREFAAPKRKEQFRTMMMPTTISPLLIRNVNFFGSKGGFDAIIARLKREPRVSINVLKVYVKIFAQLREVFTVQAKEKYVGELFNTVCELLLTMNEDQLRPLEKTDFEEIVKMLQMLLEKTPVFEVKVHELMEPFCLQFALKCFKSALLEKRLNGLQYIEEVIEQCENRERIHYLQNDEFPPHMQQSPHHMMHSFIRYSKWIDTKYMVNWLTENQIIEELFAHNPHVELIKRCSKVLKYLALKGALSKPLMDTLWNATVDKHETIVNAAQEVISENCSYFTEEQLELLFQKILQIDRKQYAAKTISLIVDFAKTQYSSIRNKAFEVLWTVSTDELNIAPEIHALALRKLQKLLEYHLFRNKRMEFINLFLHTIAKGTSVVQSLQLLKEVLETYSNREVEYSEETYKLYGVEENRSLVILHLERDFALVKLLIEDCRRYKEKAAAVAQKLADADINSTKVEGLYSHIEQVQCRLDFLSYIASNCTKLSFSKDQIDTLWQLFIVTAASAQEREAGLEWFTKLLQYSSANTTDLITYIFHTKLGSMQCSDMKLMGFRCFTKYFLHINRKADKLTPQSELLDIDLIGFTTLWNIALQAEDAAVFKEAVDFIIALLQKVHADFRGERKQAQETFIDVCMAHLKDFTGNVAAHSKQIERCIVMLQHYLEQTKATIGIASHDRGTPVTVNVRNEIPESTPAALKLKVFTNDSVALLRRKISELLNIAPELVIMILGTTGADNTGLELSDERFIRDLTLSEKSEIILQKYTPVEVEKPKPLTEQELQMANNIMEIFGLSEAAALVALRRSKFNLDESVTKLATEEAFVASVVEEASRLAPQPSSKKDSSGSAGLILVNNPSYFQLLFSLLNYESIDRLKVWEVLMRLPTNPVMLEELKNVKEKKNSNKLDWNSLLDSRPAAVFKLLYSLQIIHALMQPSDNEEQDSERVKWCKDFLYCGGFHHVFKIFTGTNINEQYISSTAWQSCLPLLLNIINFFIKGDASVMAASFTMQNKEILRHSGETLRKSVDFPSFMHMMLKLILNIAKHSDVDSMGPAMSLLVASIISRADLLKHFYDFPSIDAFVLYTLLEAPHADIRRHAENYLHLLSSAVTDIPEGMEHPHSYLLQLLLKNIPTQFSTTCEQYFSLLNRLLKDALHRKHRSSSSDFTQLLHSIVHMIKVRPVVELHRSDVEDKVLIGLMSIVHTLVSHDNSLKLQVGSAAGYGMIEELFNNCLFALPSAADNQKAVNVSSAVCKCKTHASRNMALSLLAELGTNCMDNFMQLIKLLKPYHINESKELTSWDNPKIFEKGSAGYVGLKNMGSTCYVNSLMQQFFMIPALRTALLASPIPIDKNIKAEEDLLYQIQHMFAYLAHSERQYYNPSGFCKAFKDWEGNPINTSLQADVLEFFNILCDHLEKLLKGTEHQKLLDNTFAGTLSQEFICKDCPHYSESIEPFYTISVDLKGKRNLKEALDSFVAGEMLEGSSSYSCEHCKKKVRALKRCSIKKTASMLIIHLKRFEYVIDRQTPHKLSDYFEFPMHLNIEPYTKEGLERRSKGSNTSSSSATDNNNTEFELVGVLVHSGHADAGHYYSFIKERTPEDPRHSRWFRFDDTQVSAWNINNLAEECFGGNQITTYSTWNGELGTREQPRMKNAYMLFYQRVGSNQTAPTSSPSSSEASSPMSPMSSTSGYPEALLQHIKQENYTLLRDRQLFDPEYLHFMYQLIKSVEVPFCASENDPQAAIAVETIQLATFFVFETVMRVREQAAFTQWMLQLKKLYANNVPACKWLLLILLSSRRNWFRYMLLECYDEYVRDEFVELLHTALKTLGPYEYDYFLELEDITEPKLPASAAEPNNNNPKEVTVQIPRSICARFMDNYISMLELTRQHWRRFSQYFKLLKDFALIGPWERLFLAHKNIVGLLVDYYMGPFSPNLKPGVQRVRIGDNNSPADLSYFMKAMAILVKSQATDASLRLKRNPPTSFQSNIEYPPLHEKDKRLLFNKDFFASLIKQGYNVEANKEIVAHWTWEDEERTQWMLEILMDLICKANWNACDNLFSAVEAMLEVHDSIEQWRIEITLNLDENGLMDIINYYKDRYPKFTQTCIKFALKLINQFPLAAGFLYYCRKDWWAWLEPWLRSRINQHSSDHELVALNKELKEFVEGKLATKHQENYTTLWKLDPQHDSKAYKLFIQKF